MRSRRKIISLLTIIVLSCLAMSLVDAVIRPDYAVKSAIKIILFLSLPIGYAMIAGGYRFGGCSPSREKAF